MTCSDYRRMIEAEPSLRTESLSRHVAGCSACAEFTHLILRMDQRIQKAIRVPVPENLEARILFRQAFQETRNRPAGRPSIRALAASVVLVLAAALSGGAVYFNGQSALEDDLLTVVNTATYAMQSQGPVSTAQVSKAFEPLGFHIAEQLGKVSFAGKCQIQGKVAGHMVLRHNGQPITLIFIPDRSRLLQAEFSSERWQGLLLPVASGTVAIIAPPGLVIDEIRDRVKKLVHRNTTV